MPTLPFFPWSKFDKTYDYTNFSLLPIDLNKQAAPELVAYWTDIQNIIKVYEDKSNRQVKDASILFLKNTSIATDFDEEKIVELFIYREIVALAALSKRTYFAHWNYCSSDNLKLVVQRYQSPVTSPAVSTRRRDGDLLQGFSPGLFKERCPTHVSPITNLPLDNDLIVALLKVYEIGEEFWIDIYDSILNFNLANTDSSDFRPQIELVLVTSALERLFGLIQGKEDALTKEVTQLLNNAFPELKNLPENKVLKKDLAGYKSIREAWVRDLFRLRNRYAHGRTQTKYDYSWSTQEHLLLLAYIYPLLLKLVLQAKGFYSLNDNDNRDIFTFDYLLNLNGTLRSKPNDPHSFIWDEVIGKARWAWISVKTTQNTGKP